MENKILIIFYLICLGRSSNSSRKLDRISRQNIDSDLNKLNGDILLTDTSCNTIANQADSNVGSSNEYLSINGKRKKKANKSHQRNHSNHNCNPMHKTNGRDSPSIKSVHSNHLLLNGNENDSLSSNEGQVQETNLDDLLNDIEMKNFTEEDETLKNTNNEDPSMNKTFSSRVNNFFKQKNETKKKISFRINKMLNKSKNKTLKKFL